MAKLTRGIQHRVDSLLLACEPPEGSGIGAWRGCRPASVTRASHGPSAGQRLFAGMPPESRPLPQAAPGRMLLAATGSIQPSWNRQRRMRRSNSRVSGPTAPTSMTRCPAKSRGTPDPIRTQPHATAAVQRSRPAPAPGQARLRQAAGRHRSRRLQEPRRQETPRRPAATMPNSTTSRACCAARRSMKPRSSANPPPIRRPCPPPRHSSRSGSRATWCRSFDFDLTHPRFIREYP